MKVSAPDGVKVSSRGMPGGGGGVQIPGATGDHVIHQVCCTCQGSPVIYISGKAGYRGSII
jgi:hypothetical protein